MGGRAEKFDRSGGGRGEGWLRGFGIGAVYGNGCFERFAEVDFRAVDLNGERDFSMEKRERKEKQEKEEGRKKVFHTVMES